MEDFQIETSFEEFDPLGYLREYYSHIGSENDELLAFFAGAYEHEPPGSIMLEFGGGPTIYQLISAANYVKEIHFADYLARNLEQVRRWRNADMDSWDWTSFFARALYHEGVQDISSQHILERQKLLRSKLTTFLHADVRMERPLGEGFGRVYDIVAVNFVLEGITDSLDEWKQLLANIKCLIKPGGLFVMTAIEKASFWKVGGRYYPAVYIDEADIRDTLTLLGFVDLSITFEPAEVVEDDALGFEGYKGIVLTKARLG